MNYVTVVREVWGKSQDQLDGQDLVHGETVLMKWPNGCKEQHTILLDVRNSDTLAYINHKINGTVNRLYLRWQPTVLLERV